MADENHSAAEQMPEAAVVRKQVGENINARFSIQTPNEDADDNIAPLMREGLFTGLKSGEGQNLPVRRPQ